MNRSDRFVRRLVQRSPKAVTVFINILGGVALLGWYTGIEQLHTLLPGFGKVPPSAAFAFVIAGLSLYLWQAPHSQLRFLGARICALLVIMVGLLTTVYHLFYWSLGLNMPPMMRGSFLENLLAPNHQMTLLPSISFTLAGGALYLLESRTARGQRTSEWLALGAGLVALALLIGFIYGEKTFLRPLGSPFSAAKTSLPGAFGLLLLAFGILTLRPERGWMARFTSVNTEGFVARRLMPAAVVMLLGLGVIAEAGRHAGIYGLRFEISFVTAGSILIVGLLIHRCMVMLSELESSRRITEEKLQKSEQRLQTALEAAKVGAWERDLRNNQILWSESLDDIFGLEHGSFDGRFESLLQLIHPDDRTIVQARLDRVIQGMEESYRCEYRIRCPDTSERWLAARGDLVRDSDGQPSRLAGIVVDVTERKLLERKLIEASNREQRRLGQDLHDDLGQWLTAIHLETRALSMFLRPITESGAERAEKIVERIREALKRTRMLSRGMAPAVIETGGLRAALEELAENTSCMSHARCQFICHEQMTVQDPEAALQLYRIAQEAISNALRHGAATEVEVSLERMVDGRGCLLIRDNGTGLEAPLQKGSGLGLGIMRYRAELLSADLEIRSEKEKGTEVVCRFAGRLWALGYITGRTLPPSDRPRSPHPAPIPDL